MRSLLVALGLLMAAPALGADATIKGPWKEGNVVSWQINCTDAAVGQIDTFTVHAKDVDQSELSNIDQPKLRMAVDQGSGDSTRVYVDMSVDLVTWTGAFTNQIIAGDADALVQTADAIMYRFLRFRVQNNDSSVHDYSVVLTLPRGCH